MESFTIVAATQKAYSRTSEVKAVRNALNFILDACCFLSSYALIPYYCTAECPTVWTAINPKAHRLLPFRVAPNTYLPMSITLLRFQTHQTRDTAAGLDDRPS
jgi:hypothetical protein